MADDEFEEGAAVNERRKVARCASRPSEDASDSPRPHSRVRRRALSWAARSSLGASQACFLSNSRGVAAMRPFAFLVGSCVLSAGAFALHRLPGGSDPGTPDIPPPANTVIAGVLVRVGLSAETLASCGITSPEVAGMVGAALALYDPATLRSRSEAYTQAQREESRLAALARSGLATTEDLAALAAARAGLSQADAALTSYLGSMRDAACAAVPTEVGARVQASFANRSWDLPAPYLVKDRAQDRWVALREALDTRRISEVYGHPFPASSQSTLAAFESEPEIALARSNLDSNLAAVQTAWNLAAQ